jgi:hypothetical protein
MKIHALFLLTLSFCASAIAAPASTESIEKLLVVGKAESLLESAYANVNTTFRQSIVQAAGGRPLTAEEQQRIDAMSAKLTALMKDELSWAKLKPEYIRLYRQTFDQQEVDGLIAFYATPAGQAMINKMPLLMQNTMALLQTQMAALMPKMMAIAEDTMKEPAAK